MEYKNEIILRFTDAGSCYEALLTADSEEQAAVMKLFLKKIMPGLGEAYIEQLFTDVSGGQT